MFILNGTFFRVKVPFKSWKNCSVVVDVTVWCGVVDLHLHCHEFDFQPQRYCERFSHPVFSFARQCIWYWQKLEGKQACHKTHWSMSVMLQLWLVSGWGMRDYAVSLAFVAQTAASLLRYFYMLSMNILSVVCVKRGFCAYSVSQPGIVSQFILGQMVCSISRCGPFHRLSQWALQVAAEEAETGLLCFIFPSVFLYASSPKWCFMCQVAC